MWISFTTDYGRRDGFVAACHGAIAKIEPTARVIDVTHEIREPRVSAVVSDIARIPEVRIALNEAFRRLIAGTAAAGIVVEGRDITTVVAPDAPVRILLTADYGPGSVSPSIGTLYATDTSLRPDGRTRVLGYTREVGDGGVTYFALGHCHNPASRAGRAADPTDTTPPVFRGAWETDGFMTLLGNAIGWGVGR